VGSSCSFLKNPLNQTWCYSNDEDNNGVSINCGADASCFPLNNFLEESADEDVQYIEFYVDADFVSANIPCSTNMTQYEESWAVLIDRGVAALGPFFGFTHSVKRPVQMLE